MLKRLTLAASLIVSALVLGSCTRCGWIWDQARAPQSCRDDAPKSQGAAISALPVRA
jgi:hypothetical protein